MTPEERASKAKEAKMLALRRAQNAALAGSPSAKKAVDDAWAAVVNRSKT